MEGVQQVLHGSFAAMEQPFQDELRSRLGGGKRLRAALVILTGRLFAAPPAPFHTLAAAVEMLHAATLIHDDVVDDAALRRNQAALHTVWPVGATVLAGDYLLARSASLVAELGHPPLLKIFGEALCTMAAGEIQQMFPGADDPHDPRQRYDRSIEAKTASLFAAATQMAAILARAPAAQADALRQFGRDLGMAFQMVDDVLDSVADDAALGKPGGSDLRQGLLTLPILLYLEQATDDRAVRSVLAGQRDEQHVAAALAAIRSSAAIPAALEEARGRARRAQEALLTLPDRPPRHTLAALADYVVARGR